MGLELVYCSENLTGIDVRYTPHGVERIRFI